MPDGETGYRALTPGMRRMLYTASALVFGVGVPLLVLTEYTDALFAWTVHPPLTAAFLGACYWSAGVLELLAAREREWSRARVAVPGVMLFTVLTCIPTAVNFGHFNLHSPAAYAWIAVYFLVPPILGGIWLRQARVPGGDRPRERRLPGWMRGYYFALGAGLLVLGVVQWAAPESAPWPWDLNPSDSTYAGLARMESYLAVWMLGFATVAVHTALENDLRRIRCVLGSGLALPLLIGVAIGRYPGAVRWDSPEGAAMVVVLGSLFLVSFTGWRMLRISGGGEGGGASVSGANA
jgi:hypothetical protein